MSEAMRLPAESVDFNDLAMKIARTDWDYEFSDDHRAWKEGRAQVEETLAAIGVAATIDPVGTRDLIGQFAQQNPKRPELVSGLEKTIEAAERAGQSKPPLTIVPDLPPAGVDISSLPVFKLSPTDIVTRRENLTLQIDQSINVIGRDAASERVFGRAGGGVLSIPREALQELPAMGETLTVSSIQNKILAQPKHDRGLER